MTLLIVDDEARIRDLIRKYAAFEGYNVEEASNGMEAIEKCRQKNYDLIIMDVMMPELDGFSACREIRRKSQVPVIMLSARGEEYDRIHGFELGIDDYVVKPFSPRELMICLQTEFADFATAFHEVIDFVPYEDALKQLARERYKIYRSVGFQLTTATPPTH